MNTYLETTDSAVLASFQGTIYQEIIALEKCYEMQEADSIWLERDGDVSKLAGSSEDSSQTEVKYFGEGDPLTDHHKNFWNTLKNWMSDDFNHSRYSSLILHSTQPFGLNTKLNGWNEFPLDKRLEVVSKIINTRRSEDFKNPKSGSVIAFQKKIKDSDQEKLSKVLGKVVIYTEKEDLKEIKRKIIREKLRGIPKLNQRAYLEGLMGFVINSSTKAKGWSITNEDFTQKCEELHSKFSSQEFTFPDFNPEEVDSESQEKHLDHEFVRKIIDIEYNEVIPEAIGVWLELHKSLDQELDGYLTFREKTKKYRDDLISRLNRDYSKRSRNMNDVINDSKDFYDDTIYEVAPPMTSSIHPPRQFKNGLIHDAMHEDMNLKWRLEYEESD